MSACEDLMANKSQGKLWFVSYALPERERKRPHTRTTETFANEREAKLEAHLGDITAWINLVTSEHQSKPNFSRRAPGNRPRVKELEPQAKQRIGARES
jgi:hypothetical protein